MPEDNDPIKMIVELDEAELTRQVERAEQKINSGTGGTKGSPRGASGEDLNSLLKYTQQSGKQVKDALNELNTLLKKGTRSPLQMDSTLRSIMRGYAATQNMGEYDEGGGAKYGKRQTTSLRAITRAFQDAISNAMAVRKISLPVLNNMQSPVAAATSAATNAQLPLFTSPQEAKRQAKAKEDERKRLEKENKEQDSFEKSWAMKSWRQAVRNNPAGVPPIIGPKGPPPIIGGGGGGGLGGLLGQLGGGGGGGGIIGSVMSIALNPITAIVAQITHVLKSVTKTFKDLVSGITTGQDPGKMFIQLGRSAENVAKVFGLIPTPTSILIGAFTSLFETVENAIDALNRFSPAIHMMARAFDLQMTLYKRALANALMPAIQAWMDVKKMLLEVLYELLPVINVLAEAFAMLMDIVKANIWVFKKMLEVINWIMVKLLELFKSVLILFANINLAIGFLLKKIPGMGAVGDLMIDFGLGLTLAAGAVDEFTKKLKAANKPADFSKYNQAFLDAFRISAPQNATNTGPGSDYFNKAHRGSGSSWMGPGIAGPHLQLSTHSPGHYSNQRNPPPGGAGAPPQQKGQVRLPRAAVPRTEIKNSFQMKVENDKILQETVAQVRSFLLQSMFGLRQEVQLMQAMIDPRGIR